MSNDLPPLPEAGMTEVNPYRDLGPMDPHGGKELLTWYTADQMHAYAGAAVAAERARHRFDVHSCHQGCAVAGCVNERLRAELSEAKRALPQAVLDERERWAAAERRLATEQKLKPPAP